MKLIGYREANFRPDNGKGEEVNENYNVFFLVVTCLQCKRGKD